MSILLFRAFIDGKMVYSDLNKAGDFFKTYGHQDIMSCTGARDCKDRLIYEQDFLLAYGLNWKVIFSEGCFIAHGPGRIRALRLMQGHGTAYCEIIGNTFETPEVVCLKQSYRP